MFFHTKITRGSLGSSSTTLTFPFLNLTFLVIPLSIEIVESNFADSVNYILCEGFQTICVAMLKASPRLGASVNQYVEADPSGRYGRFREVLGKGAVKTVYKAFDEVLGMEVAWNQVKLSNAFRTPEELQRLYSEVHLLKNLNSDSIIRFYASWIDVERRTFNFITEMFTSGSLRDYRQKYPRVDNRAVKNWARQILQGLAYMHGHDPPVIHRDLKCDNIFVNGHLRQVKIGDLGLAAMLRGSQHAHSVIGTPEFMAPELYEENYNELVDVYAFGMCMLEMLTGEYPYSECSNPAQIYKKVTSGKLPEAFYRIQDKEAQHFVGKCLENVSKRLSANDLLLDPFLQCDKEGLLAISQPLCQKAAPLGAVLEQLPPLVVDPTRTTDMSVTGTINSEDDTIFLKVQISDKNNGHTRNIYFPFDILNDTAIDVALEMVKELEIIDWEPLEIAEMIEEQISSLVPTWKGGSSSEVNNPQHSFKYGDDGDAGIHHPFYSNSSNSSSQASLPGLVPSYGSQLRDGNNVISGHNWRQEDPFSYDNTSSASSLNSFKYSGTDFHSGNEDDYDFSLGELGEALGMAEMHKSTRFCSAATPNNNQCNTRLDSWRGNYRGISQQQKLNRTRSFVDMRSQLLHKSLVGEINKRRLFKTIGAVENIGYHQLSGFSEKFL